MRTWPRSTRRCTARADRELFTALSVGPAEGDQPTAWTLYLASDDASATEAAVVERGGTVLMPAFDVGELGRMCIALDPSGAAFGVSQAGSHIGASLVDEPGGLAWEDLRSDRPRPRCRSTPPSSALSCARSRWPAPNTTRSTSPATTHRWEAWGRCREGRRARRHTGWSI